MSDIYAVTPGGPVATPEPPRPPLDRRQIRGSIIAGAVSFSAIGVGAAMFALPILIGVVVLLVRSVAGIAMDFGPDGGGLRSFLEGVRSFDLGPWSAIAVLVSFLGVALMVGAMFASRGILRAHRVERPWAVSWAGLGLAVVASSVLGGGFSSTWGSGSLPGGNPNADTIRALVTVLAVFAGVASIVVNAAIGGLAWWCMAIAFRPRVDVGARVPSPVPPGGRQAPGGSVVAGDVPPAAPIR